MQEISAGRIFPFHSSLSLTIYLSILYAIIFFVITDIYLFFGPDLSLLLFHLSFSLSHHYFFPCHVQAISIYLPQFSAMFVTSKPPLIHPFLIPIQSSHISHVYVNILILVTFYFLII